MSMTDTLQERISKLAQDCKSAGESSAQTVLMVLAASMQMHTDGTLALVCTKYINDVNNFAKKLLEQSGGTGDGS